MDQPLSIPRLLTHTICERSRTYHVGIILVPTLQRVVPSSVSAPAAHTIYRVLIPSMTFGSISDISTGRCSNNCGRLDPGVIDLIPVGIS